MIIFQILNLMFLQGKEHYLKKYQTTVRQQVQMKVYEFGIYHLQ